MNLNNVDSTGAMWRASLRSNIVRKIAELRKDGTVSMGFDNLCMVVKIPSGGPVGTNARWAFRQAMEQCVNELGPRNRAFVTGI